MGGQLPAVWSLVLISKTQEMLPLLQSIQQFDSSECQCNEELLTTSLTNKTLPLA